MAERGAIVLLHVARKRQIGEPRDMPAVQLLVDDGWGRRRRLGEGGKFCWSFAFLVKKVGKGCLVMHMPSSRVLWVCVDEMGMGVVGGCGW